MTDVQYIDLSAKGGSSFVVPLGDVVVTMIPRFNYTIECWCLDILDAEGNMMLAGLMLFPNIDILYPYQEIKDQIGSLILIELNTGDYKDPDLLGINTKLLWFPVGEEIVLE